VSLFSGYWTIDEPDIDIGWAQELYHSVLGPPEYLHGNLRLIVQSYDDFHGGGGGVFAATSSEGLLCHANSRQKGNNERPALRQEPVVGFGSGIPFLIIRFALTGVLLSHVAFLHGPVG
jgi:hypothetical protein